MEIKLINYMTLCNSFGLQPFINDNVKNNLTFIDSQFIKELNKRMQVEKGELLLNWSVAGLENMTVEQLNSNVLDNVECYLLSERYYLKGLYETTILVYDPIENYSMTEIEKVKNNSKNILNFGAEQTKTQNQVNAMDSDVAHDSDNSTVSTNARTDNNETSSNNERELTRKGNIGVTTSQQMIESQRNIVKLDMVEEVIKIITPCILSGVYYFED